MEEPSPSWLSLLTPLPEHVVVERKPVASAQQMADGTAGPIAGWQTVTVNLSEPKYGSRHVQLTLDAGGRLIAGGDHVMFVRATDPDHDDVATITDHESVGGRFEEDGSFRGTFWNTRLETRADEDEGVTTRSESAAPTDEQIAALRRIAADVLERDRNRRPL